MTLTERAFSRTTHINNLTRELTEQIVSLLNEVGSLAHPYCYVYPTDNLLELPADTIIWLEINPNGPTFLSVPPVPVVNPRVRHNPLTDDKDVTFDGTARFPLLTYGTEWRCWSSKPPEKERWHDKNT